MVLQPGEITADKGEPRVSSGTGFQVFRCCWIDRPIAHDNIEAALGQGNDDASADPAQATGDGRGRAR
jgi:hypothetical protein